MRTLGVVLMMVGAMTLMSACTRDPVPPISDPENIVIDGQRMTKVEFMNKYCQGKTDHETCNMVGQAIGRAASSRKGAVRF